MSERIGFYICHCGINIAYRVRVEEVAKYVATLPNVAISRDYLFMCSDPGQELIENDIRDYNLTRVVVSSCSPRMHEKTFRAACLRGGLNPYRAFHMVNVSTFRGSPKMKKRPPRRPRVLSEPVFCGLPTNPT